MKMVQILLSLIISHKKTYIIPEDKCSVGLICHQKKEIFTNNRDVIIIIVVVKRVFRSSCKTRKQLIFYQLTFVD